MNNIIDGNGYRLYQYKKPDGSFDYDKYKSVQIAGNKQKIDWVWVKPENIAFLAAYLRRHLGNKIEFGLCHGTRRGIEQQVFSFHLGCPVIGTEISDTATQFPHTIQWDFHEIKKDWLNSIDFIYSNSFDHTYDPEKCINAWLSCLNPNGLCIIELDSQSAEDAISELDPFGINYDRMESIVPIWTKGKFEVKEVIKAQYTVPGVEYCHFVIIGRKNNG